MHSLVIMLCEMKCLDLGILGRLVTLDTDKKSIDTALGCLSPNEVRKTKRKFRKVARKMTSKKLWDKMSRSDKRTHVMREIYLQSWNEAADLCHIPDLDI